MLAHGKVTPPPPCIPSSFLDNWAGPIYNPEWREAPRDLRVFPRTQRHYPAKFRTQISRPDTLMPQGLCISHLLQRLAKLFISLSLRHLNIYLSCSLFSSFLIFFSRAAEIIFSVAESHARHHGSSSFAVEQLYGLLTNARRNLGVFQHHDGITGTAKDFVVVDYATRCVYVRRCGRPSLFNSAVSRAFLRPREDLRRVGQKLQGSGTYKISPKPLADLSPTRFALKNFAISRGQRYARSKALIMRFCSQSSSSAQILSGRHGFEFRRNLKFFSPLFCNF